MKISLSWIAEFLDAPDALDRLRAQAKVLEQRLPLVGLEVASRKPMDEYAKNIVTAEVSSFEKHPDADKLNVCQVKVSDSEKYKIVCGAKNVRKGMIVALAREGTELPGNFKIKKTKIRGVESVGMMCSERELELSNEHAGIIDLPKGTELGQPLSKVLGLNDEIWEFELTPDRADCLSHVGLAREFGRFIGCSLKLPQIEELDFDSSSSGVALLSLEVGAKKACPFYSAQLFENFSTLKTSSEMLSRLTSLGLKSINAAVDITNYCMMESGQPLHVFDADKIEGSKIIVRFARKGEKLVTLDGVERSLDKEDLVIADSKGPLAIAGVMGGLESGVTEETKRIVLESAYFAPEVVRSSVQRHLLHSDSSHRFERGVDPVASRFAAGRAALLLKENCGARRRGSVVSFTAKSFPKSLEAQAINLDLRAFKKVTGLDLNAKTISDHLSTLGIVTEERSAKVLKVFVPTHRIDLLREIDLIEEVARLSGFDGIPVRYPPMLTVSKSKTEGLYDFTQALRHRLLSSSFVELMPYSFVSEKEKAYTPESPMVPLANPLSQEWAFLRSNLSCGLLRSLAYTTAKAEYAGRFFEISSVFEKRSKEEASEESSPVNESLHAAWVLMGEREKEFWSSDKSSKDRKAQVDFYDAKSLVDLIQPAMAGVKSQWRNLKLLPLWQVLEDAKALEALKQRGAWIPQALLHPGRSAVYFAPGKLGPFTEVAGFVGELHPEYESEFLNLATGKSMGVALGEFRCLPDMWRSAEDISGRSSLLKQSSIQLSSKYPVIERDLAFVFDKAPAAQDVFKCIEQEISKDLLEVDCIDVFKLEDGKTSMAFRVRMQSFETTLLEADVKKKVDSVVAKISKKFDAELR